MADINADIPSSVNNAMPSGSVSFTPNAPASSFPDQGYNVSLLGTVTITGGSVATVAAFNTGLN